MLIPYLATDMQESEKWSQQWNQIIHQLRVGDLVISPGGEVFYLAKKEKDADDPFEGTAYIFNNPGNKGVHKKDYWGVVYTLQARGRIVKRLNKI